MSTLLRLTAILLFCHAAAYTATGSAAGRWEGSIDIPGRELPLILDLDRPDGKDWAGSIIIQGLGVKGAPLADLAVGGSEVSFTIKGALGSERVGLAKFQGSLSEENVLRGNFIQAGNSVPFSVRKTGPPQLELPRQSTAVGKELEGEWKGDYEMSGYPRHVTLTLANQESGAAAAAQLVIVGKRTNKPAVALVTDEGGLLTLEAPEFGITYEGRLHKDAGEIKGTFTLGPFEVPLSLKRTR